MKKSSVLVVALFVSLFILGVTARIQSTQASGLYCSDLAKCTGEAGCPSGGSITGCEIDCVNGGGVFCNVRGDDLVD